MDLYYDAVLISFMTGKTHIACGLCAAVLMIRPKAPLDLALIFAMSAAGAVMPDVDIKNSICRKTVFPISLSVPVLIFAAMRLPSLSDSLPEWTSTFWYWTLAFAALCITGRASPHRSFTHSLAAWVLFTGILYSAFLTARMGRYALRPVAAFAIGYLFHILLDLAGFKKVQLFFPFGPRFSLKLFRTSGKADHVVGVLSVCACLCAVLVQNREVLAKGLEFARLCAYVLASMF